MAFAKIKLNEKFLNINNKPSISEELLVSTSQFSNLAAQSITAITATYIYELNKAHTDLGLNTNTMLFEKEFIFYAINLFKNSLFKSLGIFNENRLLSFVNEYNLESSFKIEINKIVPKISYNQFKENIKTILNNNHPIILNLKAKRSLFKNSWMIITMLDEDFITVVRDGKFEKIDLAQIFRDKKAEILAYYLNIRV